MRATLAEGFGILGSGRTATTHFLLGLMSALSIMLVGGIVVTYFIGTSRWCKEVVETYSLDESLGPPQHSVETQDLPLGMLSMMTMIGMIATGTASDPNNRSSPQRCVGRRPSGCCHIRLPLIAVSFLVQLGNIRRQRDIIGEIVGEVRTDSAQARLGSPWYFPIGTVDSKTVGNGPWGRSGTPLEGVPSTSLCRRSPPRASPSRLMRSNHAPK